MEITSRKLVDSPQTTTPKTNAFLELKYILLTIYSKNSEKGLDVKELMEYVSNEAEFWWLSDQSQIIWKIKKKNV